MKRIINWWKMEWEIFCFVDSVEAMNLSKFEVEKQIETIKKKYKNK